MERFQRKGQRLAAAEPLTTAPGLPSSPAPNIPVIPKKWEVPVVIAFLAWAVFVCLCSARTIPIGDEDNFQLSTVIATLSAVTGGAGLLETKPNRSFFLSLISVLLATSAAYTAARTALSVETEDWFIAVMTAIFGLALGALYPLLVRWLVHRGKMRLT